MRVEVLKQRTAASSASSHTARAHSGGASPVGAQRVPKCGRCPAARPVASASRSPCEQERRRNRPSERPSARAPTRIPHKLCDLGHPLSYPASPLSRAPPSPLSAPPGVALCAQANRAAADDTASASLVSPAPELLIGRRFLRRLGRRFRIRHSRRPARRPPPLRSLAPGIIWPDRGGSEPLPEQPLALRRHRRDRRTRCRLPEEVSAVRLSPLEQDLRRTRAGGVGRPRPSPAEGCPAPPESPRKWWCCRRVERATRPC